MLKFQKIAMFLFLMTVSMTPMTVFGLTQPKDGFEDPKSNGKLDYPEVPGVQETEVQDLIQVILDWIFKFIAALSLLMIVVGAVMYILAGAVGDTDKAKEVIFNAIIGLIVALLGLAIVKIIGTYLGG